MNIQNEWKCKLANDPMSLNTMLYVFRESSKGHVEFATMEDGHIMLHEGDRLGPVKPFLILNDYMAKELFQSLAEALGKSGYKTEINHKAEGLLEATKFHLEDMRKLLKLK